MPDIFISYSVQDEPFARFVREQCALQGLEVFLAPISLAPGDRWMPQIVEELRKSEWVFLLASRAALQSHNVQLEVGGAIFGKKKLVPIMWDVQPQHLPRWISDFQGLVLTGAPIESIASQISKLASDIKANKNKAQLVALAVLAAVLLAASKG